MNKKIKTNRKNLHGKTGDVSEKLNFTYKGSDPSYGDYINHLVKHNKFDDEMSSFDKTTVELIQNFIFKKNIEVCLSLHSKF